ncbi:MAG: glycosyltransferase family 39 protein [Chloroflexi bacterium]|nr:glycosyltransferase family 39 protein [Chloroflexota bacterium]
MTTRTRGLVGVALVLGLVAIAAFLRIYRLEDLPPGLHGDEAHAGIFAQRILKEGWIGPYANYALGGPAGILYAMAPVVKLLGPTAFAVRLTTALLGTAAVALIFLLARQMFGQRAGLIAAALLAFSYWHIHFSRIAHPVVSLPLMEIAALYFLFLGLRSARWWAFPVGGVFLGLGLYTYHPFPLFLATVVLLMLFVLIREKQRWRYHLPRFALFFGMSLLVVAPFLNMLFSDGLPSRYRTTSVLRDPQFQQAEGPVDKASVLLHKAGRTGKSFFTAGKMDGVDGLGQKGLLDPITGALFVGGVALALWRVRDERYLVLPLGTGVGLLAGILSSSMEGQYRRIIVSLPFVVLAAAAFADYLVIQWEQLLPRLKKVAPGLVLAASLAGVAYLNVNYYFRVFAPSPSLRWIFVEDLVLASRYLKGLDPDTYVYFYSGRWSWNYETRRFLLPDMKGQDRSRDFATLTLERDRDGPVAYLLLPPYHELLPQIESRYPGGTVQETRNGTGGVAFQAYYLAPDGRQTRGEPAGGLNNN